MFFITDQAIQDQVLKKKLTNHAAGALVSFEGWVRNHNQGEKVSSLEYQIYHALALKEGQKIIEEAKLKFGITALVACHREGHLNLGDCAVWIGATAHHRDQAFKACRFVIDEIKHRLPIWKKEHYLNKESQWVYCKDHHHHVHFEEKDYYSRQEKLLDQKKLKEKKVLLVGCGGLGVSLATHLASAGVGEIHLVDFDKIHISNIHRQPFYTPSLVGEKKVEILTQKIRKLNPFIKVISHDLYLNATNCENLLSGMDLVLDGSDNLKTKYLLHDACFKNKIPLLSAALYQWDGMVRTFDPKNEYGCWRCSNEVTPKDSFIGNCHEVGVVGASVAMIASFQAMEALAFLQEGQNQTMSHTLYLNTKDYTHHRIKNFKNENCQTCLGEVNLSGNDFEIHAHELDESFEIVDIRDQSETILDQYKNTNKKIALCCHRGVRSLALTEKLRGEGHSHFYSLSGGACSL